MPTDALADWERRFAVHLASAAANADAAHDVEHVRRVVANARRLAAAEGAPLDVVIPAAWLHDCVHVPKSSPDRARASALAAAEAARLLGDWGYPSALIPHVAHAVEAHSFTAGIAPRTVAARVVQDADRLDALGAVGIARTLMLGGAMGRPLYDPADPFCERRAPDDRASTIDHFYTKLLHLADRMQTAAGRAEAERRTATLHAFLDALRGELEAPFMDSLADAPSNA
ncbi:MAG: HD domain-containing protein [Gemmatirosa sp.]|nr:HD domain-containing protein [Gemmatirosa sp.]